MTSSAQEAPPDNVGAMFRQPAPEQAAAQSSALAKLMARATSGPGEPERKIRRRRMKFTISPEVCEPGLFDADFSLILTSPSSHDELEALKRAENNPAEMMFHLVKMCIVSLDGSPIKDSDMSRDTLWEALGTTGRTMVMNKWKELNEPSDDAAKKTEASTQLV